MKTVVQNQIGERKIVDSETIIDIFVDLGSGKQIVLAVHDLQGIPVLIIDQRNVDELKIVIEKNSQIVNVKDKASDKMRNITKSEQKKEAYNLFNVNDFCKR